MKIYEIAVKKPITTALIFVALIVIGLFSLSRLSVDLYPEIEINAATVMTTYSGASAQDIEQNITKTLETSLSSVTGLKEITSTSKDNISLVTLEFEYGYNMDEAVNDIRSTLDLVESYLPDGAEQPVVVKFSSDMIPIMFLSATSESNFEGLYNILDEKVVAPLNRIDGIGSVSISGAPEREVQVHVDPKKMESYGLTLEGVAAVIAGENRNLPAGKIDVGSETYSVRVDGEFKESDMIKDVIVGSYNGKNIYVRDVATVRDTLKERATEVKTNNVIGSSIIIQKQSGANVVNITKEIRKALPGIRETLPPDVKLDIVMDTSEFIQGSINSLSETVVLAGLFVMLVVLFFLGRWRATFIIILTIPVSLIAAFIYLMISGNTLNIISLSSLTIAIGMVVDDAIVVLENITTHIEKGSRPKDAAIYATNEVSVAVIASTLTIVAVFFPLTMVSGISGVMFKQLGWIVTIIMSISTLTALTLTPMLSSIMLKKDSKKGKVFKIVYGPIARMLDGLDRVYARFLNWSLSHKAILLLSVTALFIASLFLLGVVGSDFFPASDDGRATVKVELPVGTRVDKTRELNDDLYKLWREKYPELVNIQATMGESDGNNIFMAMNSSGSHILSYTLTFTDANKRKRTIFELCEEIRKDLEGIPEVYRSQVSSGGGMSMGGGSTLDVEIIGYNMDEGERLANEVSEIMKDTKGLRNVVVSREDYLPQYEVVFDRNKLAMNGITMSSAAQILRNRINGLVLSKYREDGDEYDISVRDNKDYRNSIQDIEDIAITNNMGKLIRLSEVGEVVESFSPPSITHTNKERYIKVSAALYGIALGDAKKIVEPQIKKLDFPQDFTYNFTGSVKDQQDSFGEMITLMLLVIMLVFIVMAAQFESLRDPFIIMFSLPFAFTGVFLALWMTNTPLSLIALIGAVMLIGIVVKNGIVLVDYINLNRERGASIRRSVIIGGKSRLRPVLMTTITTLLGMLPMALGVGEGSELWQPMGIAIIGGLTISTILTLIVMPVIYLLFNAGDVRRKRKKLHKQYLNKE